jgi:hypothetical protein
MWVLEKKTGKKKFGHICLIGSSNELKNLKLIALTNGYDLLLKPYELKRLYLVLKSEFE